MAKSKTARIRKTISPLLKLELIPKKEIEAEKSKKEQQGAYKKAKDVFLFVGQGFRFLCRGCCDRLSRLKSAIHREHFFPPVFPF